MWTLIIFVSIEITLVYSQNGRRFQRQQSNSGHGWDIRLAVPGEPGDDYPTLGAIPRTSFSCAGKDPGYYADVEAKCQVFRVCTIGSTYGFQSFLCPNGTLFNQAVFVCDWWMNVKCLESQQFFPGNNEKFANLKLGPQLMKDVKKMLTHSMQHPYEKTAMRSNLIIMQEYKPPSGQLIPNEALLAGPERVPSNVYIPPKPGSQYYNYKHFVNDNDIDFASSTPIPSYAPSVRNSFQQPSTNMVGNIQKQNEEYFYNLQNSQKGNLVLNGHMKPRVQTSLPKNVNTMFSQTYINRGNAKFSSNELRNLINSPSFDQKFSQPTDQKILPQALVSKKTDSISPIIQYNHIAQLQNEPYTYKAPSPQFSNEIIKDSNELRQNLVSKNITTPTVVRKTLTFNKIIEDQKLNNKPKSRITFKTWIVKPSKAARLVIEPTPYIYEKPTDIFKEKIIQTTPFFVNPTISTKAQNIISEPETNSYVYYRPKASAKQISIVTEPQNLYLLPTSASVLSGQLIYTPPSATPTQVSDFYIAPTTYKPNARSYIPPNETPVSLLRQLSSTEPAELTLNNQNAKLQSAPSSPAPFLATSDAEKVVKPSFSLIKESRINAVHNNLTFTDILTKEKLDITVKDIVKDTSKILNSASSQYFGQTHQAKRPEKIYDKNLSTDRDDFNETVSTHSKTIQKSSRLIEPPSTDLTPPVDVNKNYVDNPLSNLPFFKEPALTNTIERTISLKISIPEKVANYLFRSQNESNFDKLEILDTGSSNYLVLANKLSNTNPQYISLGKIFVDKQSNLSDSQALVFSVLADSLNTAKEYSKFTQQSIFPPVDKIQQHKTRDNEDITSVTNKISQLTSAQYSKSNHDNNLSETSTETDTKGEIKNTNSYTSIEVNKSNEQTDDNSRTEVISNSRYTSSSQQITQEKLESSKQNTNRVDEKDVSSNQIYSGQLYQLPVPDVANNIHSEENLAKLIHLDKLKEKHTEVADLRSGSKTDGVNGQNKEDFVKPSSIKPEIMKSYHVSVPRPAKLQISPEGENILTASTAKPQLVQAKQTELLDSKENSKWLEREFLNNENGISAHLQDNFFGTLIHPLDANKLISYQKDQTYYIFTQLDDKIGQNIEASTATFYQHYQPETKSDLLNAKLTQKIKPDNDIAFEIKPFKSYQFDEVKENIVSSAETNVSNNSDEITNQSNGYIIQRPNTYNVLSTDVNYSVEHPSSSTQIKEQQTDDKLYAGPSSYSAPQASVGRLQMKQNPQDYKFNSRLELFDENNSNGYSKTTPKNPFYY